jgi:hypothetical protein
VQVCVVCNRPFTWRKKWENCWDEVQCCSKRCQSERKSGGRNKGAPEAEAAVSADAVPTVPRGKPRRKQARMTAADESNDDEGEGVQGTVAAGPPAVAATPVTPEALHESDGDGSAVDPDADGDSGAEAEALDPKAVRRSSLHRLPMPLLLAPAAPPPSPPTGA